MSLPLLYRGSCDKFVAKEKRKKFCKDYTFCLFCDIMKKSKRKEDLNMSNLKNFQALLIEKGYDAAIITDQLNQQYLSGFEFHDGAVLVLQNNAFLLSPMGV